MLLIAQLAAATAITLPPDRYVGWGTLSLLNAGLAQSKNRSGLAWFLISLFLGPLATLALVLLSPAPQRIDLP